MVFSLVVRLVLALILAWAVSMKLRSPEPYISFLRRVGVPGRLSPAAYGLTLLLEITLALCLLVVPRSNILLLSALAFGSFAFIAALPASHGGCGCFGRVKKSGSTKLMPVAWRSAVSGTAVTSGLLGAEIALPWPLAVLGLIGVVGLGLSAGSIPYSFPSLKPPQPIHREEAQVPHWIRAIDRRRFLGTMASGTLLALLPLGRLAPAWACVGPPVGDLPPIPDSLSCSQRFSLCKNCCANAMEDCAWSDADPADCAGYKVSCDSDCETCNVQCQTGGGTSCSAPYGRENCWIG